MTVQEDSQKNKIISSLIDALDEIKWGESNKYDFVIRFTVYGKCKIFQPEIKMKPKERKTML